MTRLIHSWPLLGLLASVLWLSACSGPQPTSSTTVTESSQLRGEPSGSYDSIITLAVTANQEYRRIIERTLAAKLIDRGFEVARLADDDLTWDDPEQLTRTVNDLAARAGADGVLITTLVREEGEQNYVPMQVIQRPISVGFGAHAQTYMDTTVAPGYYEQTRTYVLKTTLFDTASGQSVWELYSNTVNPGSLESAARDYAVAVAEVLNQDVQHGSRP
ncbi:hypothetical protein [Marinobacter sp. JSM 1782161]|uniref:hypothetical protein n=1 Tax=Marinobacter sp. JSM 1782161 TaxID=2685906 RepID=UPI001403E524|nr:hypothetical protein [Marinobacter sp. JSM 1782161]